MVGWGFVLYGWYFLSLWSRQVLTVLKLRFLIFMFIELEWALCAGQNNSGIRATDHSLKMSCVKRVSWSYVPWDAKNIPHAWEGCSLCYPLYLQNYCERFPYTSSHRGEDSQLRCISSQLWNASLFKYGTFLADWWGGAPLERPFLRFWASSISISLQIHSHPNVCTSLEHFQMSNTEGPYSDDVA